MTRPEQSGFTSLPPNDEDTWPDGHTFIVELREALGMFAGAMPISPMQAWEDALAEVKRLRAVTP